jgi:hypothetical protein
MHVGGEEGTVDFLEKLSFLLDLEEKSKSIFLRNFVLGMRKEPVKIKKITLLKTGDPLIDNLLIE